MAFLITKTGAAAIVRLGLGLGLAMAGLAGSFPSPGNAQPVAREYDLKAAYLFNFSQFVEWPAASMADTNSPFVIGILGHNPFGGFLDALVQGEHAHGKPIVIQRYSRPEETDGAHILFISRSERPRMESILRKLNGKPILTVSDTGERSFMRRGGMIGLFTENEKVRLRINLADAQSAQLKISPKLLRLAEVVQ